MAHGLMEARLLVRNSEQLLLALVIPVGVLVAARFVDGQFGLSAEQLVPSVFALGIWSSCFTSLAISTGFERRYGVLERLVSTPLGKTGLVLGKALGITLVTLAQVLTLVVLALLLGWRAHLIWLQTGITVVAVPLAMVVFASLALAVAGTLRAEATLGLANLLYLLGASVGGILWPLQAMPSGLRRLAALTPTGALGETIRAFAVGEVLWWGLPVLAVWALVSVLLTRKVFRWMD